MAKHIEPVPCDACGETIRPSDGIIECQNCLSVRHVWCPKERACWDGDECGPGFPPEAKPAA